eukprot:g17945.t1
MLELSPRQLELTSSIAVRVGTRAASPPAERGSHWQCTSGLALASREYWLAKEHPLLQGCAQEQEPVIRYGRWETFHAVRLDQLKRLRPFLQNGSLVDMGALDSEEFVHVEKSTSDLEGWTATSQTVLNVIGAGLSVVSNNPCAKALLNHSNSVHVANTSELCKAGRLAATYQSEPDGRASLLELMEQKRCWTRNLDAGRIIFVVTACLSLISPGRAHDWLARTAASQPQCRRRCGTVASLQVRVTVAANHRLAALGLLNSRCHVPCIRR